MAAHYLGIRMNEAIRAAQEALDEQDQENTEKCMAYFRKYALLADSLLEGHPHGGCRAGYRLPGLTELLRRKKTNMKKTPDGW